MTLGQRIDEVIRCEGLKKVEFARTLKIDQSYVTQLINGRHNPSARLLDDISEKFCISRQWLETGDGEMYGARSSRALDIVTERYNGSATFRAVLDVYASLSAAEQDALERYIEQLSQAVTAGQQPERVRPKTVGEYLSDLGVDTRGAEPARESSQSDQHTG